MASLYNEGWRQGTVFRAQLSLDSLVLDGSGKPIRNSTDHDLWVVATQDCDLVLAETDQNFACIEIRPVFTENPPQVWGLRSRKLRITNQYYVESSSPRSIISPAALQVSLSTGGFCEAISEGRRMAFKIWLGLRYDRPAVPDHLSTLAKSIGNALTRSQNPVSDSVRDVLMEFDDSEEPFKYSIFAIIEDQVSRDSVKAWLAEMTWRIPVELGVPKRVEVETADMFSIALLENSYSADVTQLTWRGSSPDPSGST